MFKLSKKIKNNERLARRQAGMTYIEIIVVLGIFAVMSSVVMFNYNEFQAKVDIKNLASDIASKIVEAQKSALNGVLPLSGSPSPIWKPSYGVYFNLSPFDLGNDSKSFIYFVDLDQNGYLFDSYASLASPDCSDVSECLEKITIKKDYYISNIDECAGVGCISRTSIALNSPLSITFKRPDSSAVFTDLSGTKLTDFDYIEISIASPRSSATAVIKIYPSGRVQVN